MQINDNLNSESRTEHLYNKNKVFKSSIYSEQMSISCAEREEEKSVKMIKSDCQENNIHSNQMLKDISNAKSISENIDCSMKSSLDLNRSSKPSDKSSIGNDNFDYGDVKDFIHKFLRGITYIKASNYVFKIPNNPKKSIVEYENFK